MSEVPSEWDETDRRMTDLCDRLGVAGFSFAGGDSPDGTASIAIELKQGSRSAVELALLMDEDSEGHIPGVSVFFDEEGTFLDFEGSINAFERVVDLLVPVGG